MRDLSDQHNFRLFGPGVEEFTPVETTARSPGRSRSAEGRYTVQVRPALDADVPEVHCRQPAAGDATPKPPPVATTPKLLATVGPEEHDLAAERDRCRAQSWRQGRNVLDRRARPVEAAQLPSRRQGREQEVDGCRHRHDHLEAQARERAAPVLLRHGAEDPSRAPSPSSLPLALHLPTTSCRRAATWLRQVQVAVVDLGDPVGDDLLVGPSRPRSTSTPWKMSACSSASTLSPRRSSRPWRRRPSSPARSEPGDRVAGHLDGLAGHAPNGALRGDVVRVGQNVQDRKPGREASHRERSRQRRVISGEAP